MYLLLMDLKEYEYSEIALSSYVNTGSGGSVFTNSVSPASQLSTSWPRYSISPSTLRSSELVAFKVVAAEIPFVWDVFHTKSTFIYTNAGTPNTITIATGSPTAVSLAAALQTAISAISAGFTVTYSATTLRFTFTQALAITWSLTFGDITSPAVNLGFQINTVTSATGAGSSIVSPTIPMVSGPYFLNLNSATFGSIVDFNNVTANLSGATQSICRIPINANYGEVVFYSDQGI
jgi:hypothetical protein